MRIRTTTGSGASPLPERNQDNAVPNTANIVAGVGGGQR